MKKCKNCGAELPDGASFCHRCATSQLKPTAVPMPRRGRWFRPVMTALLVVLLLAAGAGGYALLTRELSPMPEAPAVSVPEPPAPPAEEKAPQILDAGGPELEFDGYRLVLSFYEADGVEGIPTKERTVCMSGGSRLGCPTLLNAFDAEGRPAWDRFRERVKDVSVVLDTAHSERISCTKPAPMEDFSGGDLASRLEFDSNAGEAQVRWLLELETGETLQLSQQFRVEELQIREIHAGDAPMNTLEELQQLIDRIAAEENPATVVNLYLPPVTYEGTLRVHRAVNLLGDLIGETKFSGSVVFTSEEPETCSVQNILFEGTGGAGIEAHTSVRVYGCSFRGYDVGLQGVDQGWIAPADCSFLENAVGMQYNLLGFHYSDSEVRGCSFVRNGTAVEILAIPDTAPLSFLQSQFLDNGVDLHNPTNYPVILP